MESRAELYHVHLPAVLWAVLMAIFLAMPGETALRIADRLPIPALDKLVHGALFFVWALLLWRSLSRVLTTTWKTTVVVLVVSCLYGVVSEIGQGWVSGRSPEAADVGADLVGTCLALLLIALRRQLDGAPPV